MRGDDKKEFYPRVYRLRDTATLVSSLSAIIMAFGVIGKFYVDSYRLSQLERVSQRNSEILEQLRKEHNAHSALSEGKIAEFNLLKERVAVCCPFYRGR